MKKYSEDERKDINKLFKKLKNKTSIKVKESGSKSKWIL